MSKIDILMVSGWLCVAGFFFFYAGVAVGAQKQRNKWQRHMDRCNDYRTAVDDLDRWCGHRSPHARLIARHIKAHGEGSGYNAGTPTADEACSVSGLRDQLSRLDAAAPTTPKG